MKELNFIIHGKKIVCEKNKNVLQLYMNKNIFSAKIR